MFDCLIRMTEGRNIKTNLPSIAFKGKSDVTKYKFYSQILTVKFFLFKRKTRVVFEKGKAFFEGVFHCFINFVPSAVQR